jgi:hypothetical protein
MTTANGDITRKSNIFFDSMNMGNIAGEKIAEGLSGGANKIPLEEYPDRLDQETERVMSATPGTGNALSDVALKTAAAQRALRMERNQILQEIREQARMNNAAFRQHENSKWKTYAVIFVLGGAVGAYLTYRATGGRK